MRPGMKLSSDGIDWDMVAQAREPHPERLHLVEDRRRARRKAADAAYYQANKERIDQRNRAWREANKEEMRRYDKAYAPARNTGENGQAAADNSIRSVSAASAEPHRSGRRL